MKKPFVMIILLTVLVACGTNAPESSMMMTEGVSERDPATTATASATSVPTQTPSPVPTLSAAAQLQVAFVAAADEFCESAFDPDAEHAWGRRIGDPIVALVNIEYEGDSWTLSDLIPPPDDIEEVVSIACIRQTRIHKGNYFPVSGSAYQLQWDIWLVSWPEGGLIGSRTFLGGSPPRTKTGPGDRYGSAPSTRSVDWIESALREPLSSLDAYLYSLAYIPQGPSLLTNYNMTVYEVDAATGEMLSSFEFSDPAVSHMTYSPDGRLAAASICTQRDDAQCTAGEIEVLSLISGEQVFTLRGDPEYPNILSLDFTPDSRTLISGHSGNIEGTTRAQIWRWDMATGHGTILIGGEIGHVSDLSISPTGDVFIANIGARIWVLDLRSGEQVSSVQRRGNWPSFEVSHDGSMLAVGYCSSIEGAVCGYGGVMLWDLEAEAEIASWLSGESNIYAMAFSPDGATLSTAACIQSRLVYTSRGEPIMICTAADITLWSTSDGSWLQTFSGYTGGIAGLAFSSDGTRLYSAGYNGTIRIWEPDYAGVE